MATSPVATQTAPLATRVPGVKWPSDVKSRQDSTGHNGNKPAGQREPAVKPPLASQPGYEKSGFSWRVRLSSKKWG